MTMIKTYPGAILGAAAMATMFVLICVATGLGIVPVRARSIDAQVLLAVSGFLAFATIFTFGHLLARRHGVHQRWGYAGIGAVAALPPYLLAAGARPLAAAAASGTVSLTLLVPLAIGGLTGFLYHRQAGYDCDNGDEVVTAATEIYDGPIVVRTSPGAVVVAGLIVGGLLMLFTVGFVINTGGFAGPVPGLHRSNPGMGVSQAILGSAITSMPLVYIAHRVLRVMRQSGVGAYAVSGMILPGLLGLALTLLAGPMGVIVMLQMGVPSVAGMLAYRKLAGIEPAPLPEVVEVVDRRTLVAADHATRRAGRVVDVAPPRAFGRAVR